MTMRVKWGFWLSVNKIILSATLSSPLSQVPTSVCTALTVDPSWGHAMEEEYDALIINNIWDLQTQVKLR
jgi:hypothetical protein